MPLPLKKILCIHMQTREIDVPRVSRIRGDVDHVRLAPAGLPPVGKDNQHLFGYVVGGIGRGKTTMLLNLLRLYLEEGAWAVVGGLGVRP